MPIVFVHVLVGSNRSLEALQSICIRFNSEMLSWLPSMDLAIWPDTLSNSLCRAHTLANTLSHIGRGLKLFSVLLLKLWRLIRTETLSCLPADKLKPFKQVDGRNETERSRGGFVFKTTSLAHR